VKTVRLLGPLYFRSNKGCVGSWDTLREGKATTDWMRCMTASGEIDRPSMTCICFYRQGFSGSSGLLPLWADASVTQRFPRTDRRGHQRDLGEQNKQSRQRPATDGLQKTRNRRIFAKLGIFVNGHRIPPSLLPSPEPYLEIRVFRVYGNSRDQNHDPDRVRFFSFCFLASFG